MPHEQGKADMGSRIGGDDRGERPGTGDQWGKDERFVESFKPLVEFLGSVCGPMTEVALHNTVAPGNPIIAIANGDVSGRRVGVAATDSMPEILHQGLKERRDYVVGYATHSAKNDRDLISSAYFIRREGRIIGMLCINTDQSALEDFRAATQALQGYFPLTQPAASLGQAYSYSQGNGSDGDGQPDRENLSASVESMGKQVIWATVAKTGRQPDRFNASERFGIIRELDKSGYFQLKGAISAIAGQLGLADSSIYRYLHRIHRT